MPVYRRAFVPGGTFFFTLVTEGRARFLCDERSRACLRAAFAETRRRWPFTIDAIVLLLNHLHTLWTLPEDDADFSTRWSYLKSRFTRSWLRCGGAEQPVGASRRKNRRRGNWQRRFWEHAIRDERDFERHCDYIHYNPVKHEVASCPHAWPYSTFEKWVAQGVYGRDWQCSCARWPTEPLQFDDLDETAME
ncbi:MAG: transposase [Phycisphaerae bacterium]|nr:transposase [Phycisphaerae bacterium]